MNKVIEFKDQLVCEILQKNELQKNLLVQVLCSKRLLSEHLESLEEVANILFNGEHQKSSYLTLLSTSGCLISSYGIFNYFGNKLRYVVPIISGAVSVMYLHKTVNLKQRISYETKVKNFIIMLDDFEFSVKKATNFINDAQHIKAYNDTLNRFNKNRTMLIDLFNLLKRVIRALYCFVKYLEYCFKIDEKFEYFYQEIDDVDNCEIMRDYIEETGNMSSKFKAMFSLFAYVQSYLLLRLGIIFASNLDESKFILSKKLDIVTEKVKRQTSLLPNFVLMQKEESEIYENIQKLIDTETNKTISKDLVQIRSSTADFTLKVLSLLLQLNGYQDIIVQLTNNYQDQNKKDMDNVINYLEDIGLQLSVCSDEQNRLLILMKKYLNKDTEVLKVTEEDVPLKVESSPIKIIEEPYPHCDEFFFMDPARQSAEEKELDEKLSAKIDLDEEDIQVKMTKKCFKPVLAQLKERIVVIDEDMKEREKKVLKEKGIEMPEVLDESNDKYMDSEDDFGSEIDLENLIDNKKLNRSRKKFEESRELLESKLQFNPFGQGGMFPIPNGFVGLKEEVLE